MFGKSLPISFSRRLTRMQPETSTHLLIIELHDKLSALCGSSSLRVLGALAVPSRLTTEHTGVHRGELKGNPK